VKSFGLIGNFSEVQNFYLADVDGEDNFALFVSRKYPTQIEFSQKNNFSRFKNPPASFF
jgi:hypothetical protein